MAAIGVPSCGHPARVLILGGGYGGMAAAVNLADLCAGKASRFGVKNQQAGRRLPVEITIVDERDGYYHLIGSPLAMADEKYANKIWAKFQEIPALQHPQFRIKQGSALQVDLQAKTTCIRSPQGSHTEELGYNYLVAATGLRRAWPSVPQTLTKDAYLQEIRPHVKIVAQADQGVAVIGGGAVGVEMAAELKLICAELRVVLIHSRDHLLSSESLPADFKDQTLTMLQEAGVETIMGTRVQEITSDATSRTKTLHLSDESELTVTEVINAVSGPNPTTTYLPQETLNAAGEVTVNSNLTFADASTNVESHFAIGDLVPQKGVKRCGGAMHHGHYAAYNIHQHMLFTRGIIQTPEYLEVAEHGVNIGLAVGKKAIGYSEDTGIMAGEDTLKYLFGDDLGFKYCWDYLKLSQEARDEDAEEVDTLPEPENAAGTAGSQGIAVSAEA